MQKRWVLVPEADRAKSESLQRDLGIHPVLADLLIQRGMETFQQAKDFFRPDLNSLPDPLWMKDMDRALGRIEEALGRNEKILIYGDYDVDGTTAVSVVFGFFRQFHSRIEYYLPDRYTEGYGLSYKAIDYAAENGFSLIITLDCGIKAVQKVRYANEKQIDVIIGDHHLPGEELPPAYAILDPKRKDCPYPYKELTGCGIGFKIVQGFIAKNGMDMELAYQYLDLVAVSIASDIVPITGENRILAHFGLRKLNTNPNCGLQALIELAGSRKGAFTINDILFQLGPRINAAGRIGHARNAVRLLLSKSLQEAASYGGNLDEHNTQRKDFDARITEEALELAGLADREGSRRSTVLFKEDWHKGVIGIVASRLVERFYRPTVILTQTNGHVTGSARSIPDFDLYEALSACSDLLDQYGGHKFAAGLTMEPAKIGLFAERFEQVVQERVSEDMMTPRMVIDAELGLDQIDARFFRVLRQFEPFGPQQEAPVFLSRDVTVYGQAQVVGENHLKLTIVQDNSPAFSCIGFGLGQHADRINTGKPFSVCYVMEENIWRGKHNLQLNLKDIR